MKKRSVSACAILFLMLALLLITAGSLLFTEVLSRFEELALYHENREMLLVSMRAAALSMTVYGSMIAVGIGILLILFLHMIHRTARIQRETEAMVELNRQIQALAHHQRLETIGMMTSSIAHEFNNLLTPIMGYSLMALEKLPPEEEELYDEILEIYNSSRKAKTIISRLSDLSRKNTGTAFRPVSIDDIVRKTLDVANPAKPEKVQVKLDLNCWDQTLQANEIQLNQLLLNLILNSFHAMGDEPGTLTLATAFDESYIHIWVEDTGCGMDKAVLSKIFEPFFTTKEAGRGTGLGLAIAAQVVEDHHGTIHVESKKGEGTRFEVALPRLTDLQLSE